MKWLLVIIAVFVIFAIYKKRMAKIDKDYEKAINTPGRACYLRDNYPTLVAYIESLPDYAIEFERADSIRYINSDERIKKKVVIQQFSDMICVAFALDNVALKQWKFKKCEYTDKQMADKVQAYLMYKA